MRSSFLPPYTEVICTGKCLGFCQFSIVYYGEIKRELKRILIYECWCNERLKAKAEGSTRLAYTGLRGGMEYPRLEL